MGQNNIDITENEHNIVKGILNKNLPSDVDVFVFGSRSTFKTKKSSDLDIGIQHKSKLNQKSLLNLSNDFDESLLPYKVDVIDLKSISDSFYNAIKNDLVRFDLNNFINYNPDILNCLANLSNDEVFTPPNVVNDMLDMLPKDLWGDKNATFLDPCTKSGVFLREIVKRLDKGLAQQIPDTKKRITHILKNQVFGIAITELTALIARRTVYCAKDAGGVLSVAENVFDNEHGNIKMFDSKHDWGNNGKCTYCGVNKNIFDRGEDTESYAYDFIHTDEPQKLFTAVATSTAKGGINASADWGANGMSGAKPLKQKNIENRKGEKMKFDVIIGNPPYQMDDGGNKASAKPLYHRFIQQAKKLQPRYLSMIVPARWYAGGKGLDEFRAEMLNDNSLTNLTDFPNAKDCFSGVEIKGGVCYFLWDRDNKSNSGCEITNMSSDGIVSQSKRPLLEEGMDTLINFNLQKSEKPK